jgi:hypothetical protein
MSRVATRGRRARRNAAGRERTRALVLGVLAVVALISLKISTGATGAGLLWNRSPGHPPAGMDGPWSPLVMLGWGSALIFWGTVLAGAVLLIRWAREATAPRSGGG